MEENRQLDAGRTSFLPMEKIVSSQDMPQSRSERTALRELADSIREDGLIRPITVEALPDGQYQVVSGHRRLRACQMCGMTHIDAVVAVPREEVPSGAKRLLEQLRRGGLHCTEQAELLHTLHERMGMSVLGIAEALGCSGEDIERTLSLMQLSASVRQALREKNAPERAALALLRVPEEKARLRIIRQTGMGSTSVRDVMLLADYAARQQAAQAAQPPQAPQVDKSPSGEVLNLHGRGAGCQEARMVVRDGRLYLNAIRSLVAQMQAAGMAAELREQGDGTEMEMVVRIVQPRRRMIRCHQSVSAQAR